MVILYAFALVAGISTAFQSGANATLTRTLDQPFLVALVVVGVGALVFVAGGLASGRLGLPEPGRVADAPWWAWIGGVFGALIVLSQLFVARTIGAGPYVGITVVAGVLTSLLLDHFGLMGFKEHALNLPRVAGGVLMAAGVLLVALF